MANIVAPFGFRPVKRREGSPYTGGFITRKAASTAGALNRGDMVSLDAATGFVKPYAPADGAIYQGIYIGCHYTLASMGYPVWANYWPGAGALGPTIDVMIIDDLDVVYEVQANAGPITRADIGSNAEPVVAASTTGFSKWSLGAPTTTASTAFPWKIYDIGNSGVPVGDGYDVASANNIVQVVTNAHLLRAGIGV